MSSPSSSSVQLPAHTASPPLAHPATSGNQTQLQCSRKCPLARRLHVSYSGLRKCSTPSITTRCLPASHAAQRRSGVVSVVASAPAPADDTIPSLNALPLNSFINSHGKIIPSVDPTAKATVFAVLDKNKKVQYVGFSKDLRNSLRILMGRRPEMCYFYKLYNLPALDQEKMMQARNQWMSELGITPIGNSDPVQRKLWEQPVESGSISERGRIAAAKAKAKTLQQMFVDRGISEEMVYDPNLLADGKCDILPSHFVAEEASQETEDSLAQRKAVSIKTPSGDTVDFDIEYEMKFKTNGGWMYDIVLSKDDAQTRHRVIVGGFFPKSVSMPEDDFLETIMGFLLHKRIPRHTEGLLDLVTFPINYFAITEVQQFFKDLDDWFPSKLPDAAWRFQRTEMYGAAIDPPPPVGPDDDIIPLSVSRRQQASA